MSGSQVVHRFTSAGDIGPPPSLGALSWDPASCEGSLEVVYNHVTGEAETAIAWYLRSKRPKQRLARWIRGSAIILAALAGIIPMLSEVAGFRDWLHPVWASVMLGLAAALVMLDRFFGFSTAWIRYISTELHLRQILDEFRLDWEAQKIGWKNATPTDDETQRAVAHCHSFVTQVNGLVREETSLWVAEFQDTVKQLDETVKVKVATAVPGALSVVITNGDQCEGDWLISIDGGATRHGHGKTASVPGLVPGIHTVRVEGTIGAKASLAEKPVTVAAGDVVIIELTLS